MRVQRDGEERKRLGREIDREKERETNKEKEREQGAH